MSPYLLIGLSLLAIAACSPNATDPLAPASDAGLSGATATASDPVAAVIERAEMCTHWGGEEPYDAERRAQINEGIEDAGCETLIKDAATVKAAHPEAAARIDAALEPLVGP